MNSPNLPSSHCSGKFNNVYLDGEPTFQKSNHQDKNLASVADKKRGEVREKKRYKVVQPKSVGKKSTPPPSGHRHLDIAVWPSSQPSPSSTSSTPVSHSHSRFHILFQHHPYARLTRVGALSLAVLASLFARLVVKNPLIVVDIDIGILLFVIITPTYIIAKVTCHQ